MAASKLLDVPTVRPLFHQHGPQFASRLLQSVKVTVIVIALKFFALFSLPSPSFFFLYDLTTLSLFLYPDNHSFIPFFYLPFHTSQEQEEAAHGLHLTIRY